MKNLTVDFFGHPINPGDRLVRVVNGHLQPCICTKVTTRVYFTCMRRKWIKNRGCEFMINQLSSYQNFINVTALNLPIEIPESHINFYNQLKQKKNGN